MSHQHCFHVLPSLWFIYLLTQKSKCPLFLKSRNETLGIVWIGAGTETFRLDPLMRDLIKAKLGSCDEVWMRPLLLHRNSFLSRSVTPCLLWSIYGKVQHAIWMQNWELDLFLFKTLSFGNVCRLSVMTQVSLLEITSSSPLPPGFLYFFRHCWWMLWSDHQCWVPKSDWHARGSKELRNPNRSVCWTKR